MAWSETMFIIQHFYNAFDINNRLIDLESKVPLIAKSIDGKPEGVLMEDLTPGTLWFIKEDNKISTIKALSILTKNNTFADPIPFNIDLNNIFLDNDIKNIIDTMGLNAETYNDIIKVVLEILSTFSTDYAKKQHTSSTKEYGIGTENLYGHLKITDNYKELGIDSENTAISVKGANKLWNRFSVSQNPNDNTYILIIQ